MTDKESVERLEKIKLEQESFLESYKRKNRKQQDLIARDFMHQHSGYLIERVQEMERNERDFSRLYKSWQKTKQKEFSLAAENQRLKRRVEMLEYTSRVSNSAENLSVMVVGENHNLKIDNKRYREVIKKAIEEEEQNLEGYQSTVHKILAEALEELK